MPFYNVILRFCYSHEWN